MSESLFVQAPKSGDIQDMQFYYDKCLPGNSTVLNDFDAVTINNADISLNVKDCTLDFSKSVPLPKDKLQSPLTPVIRTAAEKPRQSGLLENLVAMIKRNFNSPELSGIVDIENTASVVVDRFFDSYFLKDKISSCSLGDSGGKNIIDRQALIRWMEKQEKSTIGQLADFDFIDLPAIDQYRHIIKSQPKQKLDLSIQSEYPSLQTIVYHSKKINALFGPIFSELTRQMLSAIDSSRFLFFTRRTP